MHFHEQKCIDEQSLLELYGSVGWTAYTTDSKQLTKAVEQSLKVITVWQEKELIGLIRSVGMVKQFFTFKTCWYTLPIKSKALGQN